MDDRSFRTDPLVMLLQLIDNRKLSEIESERLLNAAVRYQSGVPTGISADPNVSHTHLK